MTQGASPGMRAFMGAYGLLWKGARPLLRRHKRLRDGFADRLVPPTWGNGPVDVWIQAASGGEAYLARQLVTALAGLIAPEKGEARPALRIVCTSCTRQGLDTLTAALPALEEAYPFLSLAVCPFPLDEPQLMFRALDQARPRLVALLETELWPGLMAACAARNVPLLVLNGRMTEKSLKGYRLLGPFWHAVAPKAVLATSPDDGNRFAALFGAERVGAMPNMKFDAFATDAAGSPDVATSAEMQASEGARTVAALLPQPLSVLLLASVREQEEATLVKTLASLRVMAPEAAVVVAPRHMERVDAWRERLQTLSAGRRVYARTAARQTGEALGAGEYMVWDAFGELRDLYARANAVFVGGSLAPLGGQNFLEPAFAGLVPCVGPSWSNFAWVGADFFREGLGVPVTGAAGLAAALAKQLRDTPNREAVRARLLDYIRPRRGGTQQAAKLIADTLAELPAESASKKTLL